MTEELIRVAPRGWGTQRTVSSALRLARPGAVISIAPGEYREALLVNRTVTLFAEQGPDTVRITAGHGAAVTVQDGDPVFRELTLVGAGDFAAEATGGRPVFECCDLRGGLRLGGDVRALIAECELSELSGPGVLVEDGAEPLLRALRVSGARGDAICWRGRASGEAEDCDLENPAGTGLRASGEAMPRIRECRVRRAGEAGIAVGGEAVVDLEGCRIEHSAHAGVVVVERGRLRASGTTVSDCGDSALVARGEAQLSFADGHVRRPKGNAVFAVGRAQVTLAGCELAESGYSAVHLGESAKAVVRDTQVSAAAEHGLRATGSALLRAERTTVAGSRLAGVAVEERADVELVGCRIAGNETGVLLRSVHRALIEDCEVVDSGGAGIELAAGGGLVLDDSSVTGSGSVGVRALADSLLIAGRSRVLDTLGTGLALHQGARAVLWDCAFLRSKKNAVYLAEQAEARLAGCELAEAGLPALYAAAAARLTVDRCRFHDLVEDVQLADGAVAEFEGCVAERVEHTALPEHAAPGGLAGVVPLRRDAPARPGAKRTEPPHGTRGRGRIESRPESEPASLDELLHELDSLVGLERVKRDLGTLVKLAQLVRRREDAGLPPPPMSRHLVFAGNPGTGKTTVARLYGRILHALGMLASDHLVEADRGDLIGEYVGHTAPKTTAVFRRALGGVLFIDEAYAIAPQGKADDFGREALSTLVKLMEDHRDEVVVIVAGYPQEMAGFVAANPGLESRFSRTLTFEDYTGQELVRIVDHQAAAHRYELSAPARVAVSELFDALPRGTGFGNGRTARQLFQRMTEKHAQRVADLADASVEDLSVLLPADLPLSGDGRVGGAGMQGVQGVQGVQQVSGDGVAV